MNTCCYFVLRGCLGKSVCVCIVEKHLSASVL